MTAPSERANPWGRVAEDGTVFVRIGEEERAVGQYPAGTAEEALAFFTKRYDAVALEVQLLEQRVLRGALSPDEARTAIDQLTAQCAEPNFVGDVIALTARLEALRPVLSQQREQRREERARRTEEARAQKVKIVETAERIASGRDWRRGAQQLRDLLTEWKGLARLDRATDDELWHRFSTARTAYTKARKAHFAELDQRRAGAREVKERLVREAEALADSTDWGPTAGRYRNLMRDWKSAGPAPRGVDDELWQRFRAAQDRFFGARDAANAEQDRAFAANAEAKRLLLTEAEALVPRLQEPGADLAALKRAFRDIAERWDAAGKVPRDQMGELEGRIRKVEQAIRGVEDEQWRRSDPEKSARADDMVSKLREAIAKVESDLAAARDRGDTARVASLEKDLEARRSFLAAAEKAAADFG